MGIRNWFTTAKNYTRDEILKKWVSGLDFTGSGGVSTDVSGNNALKYNTFWACCRVLAETYAMVPLNEYKRLPNGDRERTNDTGLFDVLHHMYNSQMSAYAAKEASMYNLNLGGNAVCVRGKNRLGETISLTPHPWQNVNIKINKDTGRLEYKIKTLEGERTYTRSEVLHVAGPTADGLIGLSPVEAAADSIALGRIYEKFGRKFYENGVISSGWFGKDGTLTDEAYARLKEDIDKNYAGVMNSGRPMLLEDGLKFNQLSMKLVDAELLSSKKYQVEDVCRIFRMPLHLVQSLDHATNNNIEQQALEFVMYTMQPHFKRFEDAINTQLLTKEMRDAGYYFEHNMDALLRGDQKSRAEAFAVGRQWGWLSVNDIRSMMNMNRIENGDIYLEPLNMGEAGGQEGAGDA